VSAFPIIGNLITWRFGIGVLVGAIGQRVVCWIWHRIEDRRHPLPDGKRRKLAGLSRTWLIGAAVVTVLGYQLYVTQDLARCQQEFGAATARRSQIGAENDRLSLDQRELLADAIRLVAQSERDGAEWLTLIIHPTDPAVAELDINDPVRQRWSVNVTIKHFTDADRINAEHIRSATPPRP
jgi:hypothetical protein